MTYVNVKYIGQRGDQAYSYMLPSFLNVEKGDIVVVETRDTYSLARIINFHGTPEYATKHVVQKLDLDQFNTWRAGSETVPF